MSQNGTSPRSTTGAAERLGFLVDVGETFESELPPELRPQIASGDPRLGGLSTIVDASADYAHNRQSFQLEGTASTAFKYYRQLDEVVGVTHSAGLRLGVRLPKRGSLQLSQTVAYSPSYFYLLFPTATTPTLSDSVPTDPDFRVATQSLSYDTNAALTFGSPRTMQVTMTGAYSRTNFQQPTVWRPNLAVYSGGLTVTRSVARNGSLFADYQYRTGEFGFGGRAEEQRGSVGVQYSHTISVRQRVSIRFDIAPATMKMPATALSGIGLGAGPTAEGSDSLASDSGLSALTGQVRVARLEGEAKATYQLRRAVQTEVSYRRGVDYVPLLAQPILVESAQTELTSTITRRLGLMASAAYANGTSAFSGGGNDIETRTGQVKMRYLLKRSTTIYAEYRYFYYNLRQQAILVPDLPSVFGQHALRIGLTLSVKAFGK
jgi:hypothetical protein